MVPLCVRLAAPNVVEIPSIENDLLAEYLKISDKFSTAREIERAAKAGAWIFDDWYRPDKNPAFSNRDAVDHILQKIEQKKIEDNKPKEKIMTDLENMPTDVKIDTEFLKNVSSSMEQIIIGATRQILEEYRKPIVLQLPGREPQKIPATTHKQFKDVLTAISAGLNVFLVGEAGAGKTHLVEQCAESLKLPFYCTSVCAQTTASVLMGYMNANGEYVRTLFRDAYENGGIFLLDEIDNGNPNVLAVLNSAMANSVCAFPDKMVKKHPDFILCASGNTYGTGADRRYVGRLEIDGATLDRFVFIELKYDEALERTICGNESVANLIQYLRGNARRMQMRHIISPRASMFVAKLVRAGTPLMDALQACVFKGMSEEEISKVKGEKFNKWAAAVK